MFFADATLPPADFGAALLRMLTALVVVLILLGLTFWALKRLIRNRQMRGVGLNALQLIEKKMISPKTMLYLVELDGKRILFAESQLEVTQLLDPDRKETISPAVRSSAFSV